MKTRIAGIPCVIDVTYYSPGSPGRYYGHPDSLYPEEPAEIVWRVLDRRGYPAPWLERKLRPEDRERIERELLEHIRREREDVEPD